MLFRISTLLTLIVLLVFCATSCQKEITDGFINPGTDSTGGNTNPTGTCVLKKIIQGVGDGYDTATTFFYAGTAISSYNVTYFDQEDSSTEAFEVAYTSGNVTSVRSKYSDFQFEYNDNAQLTTITGNLTRLELSYANTVDSIPAKMLEYYQDQSSTYKLSRYFEYSYNNGNVTAVKMFSPAGTQTGTLTLTYSNLLNNLQGLGLFDVQNFLGLYDIFPENVAVTKNLIASYAYKAAGGTEGYNGNVNYTVDDHNNISSATTTVTDLATQEVVNTFHKFFEYDCH